MDELLRGGQGNQFTAFLDPQFLDGKEQIGFRKLGDQFPGIGRVQDTFQSFLYGRGKNGPNFLWRREIALIEERKFVVKPGGFIGRLIFFFFRHMCIYGSTRTRAALTDRGGHPKGRIISIMRHLSQGCNSHLLPVSARGLPYFDALPGFPLTQV